MTHTYVDAHTGFMHCVAWSAIAAVWLGWASGRIAAILTRRRATGPDFDGAFRVGLVRGDWETLWPGVPRLLVTVIFGIVASAALPIPGRSRR